MTLLHPYTGERFNSGTTQHRKGHSICRTIYAPRVTVVHSPTCVYATAARWHPTPIEALLFKKWTERVLHVLDRAYPREVRAVHTPLQTRNRSLPCKEHSLGPSRAMLHPRHPESRTLARLVDVFIPGAEREVTIRSSLERFFRPTFALRHSGDMGGTERRRGVFNSAFR